MAQCKKIDVHSHFLPPEYRSACINNGHAQPDGMPSVPSWSEEEHLRLMESANIEKSILSISSPGTSLKAGDSESTISLTRHCNDFAADLKKRHPDRFGFWATLPLPDVSAAIEEVTRAADVLNADGFVMETNYHGTYLGDKAFDTVFDEINRRKGIVFMHPTTPCLASGTAATPLPQFNRPMFEFFFDTARAVINLFTSGTVTRCPNITFIIPHLGGAFPPLINRAGSFSGLIPGVDPNFSPHWIKEKLKTQFFFDSAGFAFPEQIQGLLSYVTIDRILYGSDFPFTPAPVVLWLAGEHDKYLPGLFPEGRDQEKLYNSNAAKLLHREHKQRL